MLLRMSLMILVASRFMNTLGGVDEGGGLTAEEIVRERDKVEEARRAAEAKALAAKLEAQQKARNEAAAKRKQQVIDQIHEELPHALARQHQNGCPDGRLLKVVSHYTTRRHHWYSKKTYHIQWAVERVCYTVGYTSREWDKVCVTTDQKFYTQSEAKGRRDSKKRKWVGLHVFELDQFDTNELTRILEALKGL